MPTLRSKLIRLAFENEEARPHILPLLAKHASIEDDTPILPGIVADTVVRELVGYFWDAYEIKDAIYDQQDKLVKALRKQAEATYAANERFRSQIQERGNAGRDQLYVFMRHWLAAMIQKSRKLRHIYPILPPGFANGEKPRGQYTS